MADPMTTIDELTERTRDLEEVLQLRIEDFEGRNAPARVVEVRVLEPYHDRDDETHRDQEVEVRLDAELPKKKRKDLGRDLRNRLRKFQRATGCRVTEILVEHEDRGDFQVQVEVRVDLLAYPRRLLKTTRRTLEEDIAGLLDSFTRETEGRVVAIDLTEDREENRYRVRVTLDPSSGA